MSGDASRAPQDDAARIAPGPGLGRPGYGWWKVFVVFFQLGTVSFGGPIAHLGYFRDRLIVREKWISEKEFADIVALCQFLPGPASSQVGMAIGYRECGFAGAVASFVGFTLPSSLIMLTAGVGVGFLEGPVGGAVIRGLQVAAVAVVAQAVWEMARKLCPDSERIGFAVASAVFLLVFPSALSQVLVIIGGGVAGYFLLQAEPDEEPAQAARALTTREWGRVWTGLGAFVTLLVVVPLMAILVDSHTLDMFNAYYRTGSIVFGGGHIILPLLESEVVQTGWVDSEDFLAGYGVAQAIPGPLCSFATFLGAVSHDQPNGLLGAFIATIAIFLPACLLIHGGLPLWDRLRNQAGLKTAFMGVNGAVVGLLVAAFYDPVWINAIELPADFALALLAFTMLTIWRVPSVYTVFMTAGAGFLLPYVS